MLKFFTKILLAFSIFALLEASMISRDVSKHVLAEKQKQINSDLTALLVLLIESDNSWFGLWSEIWSQITEKTIKILIAIQDYYNYLDDEGNTTLTSLFVKMLSERAKEMAVGPKVLANILWLIHAFEKKSFGISLDKLIFHWKESKSIPFLEMFNAKIDISLIIKFRMF